MEEWVVLFKNSIVQRFFIEEGQCLSIGRDSNADVIINNSSVSRKHTSLELKNGCYFLSDLHSMNGTRVNGRKIYSDIQIKKSDNISIGKFTLKRAEFLGEEVESGSAVSEAMDIESQNQTLYVSGIHKRQKKSAPQKALLAVLTGGATPARFILRGKRIKAGKDAAADLVIPGFLLAKTAFVIEYRPQGYFIIPQAGLLNKVMVNGKRLRGEKLLKPMDVIAVGKSRIRFS
jgi:pSer/pThr/pTyr-binding forkhead associated (FHA) protein